MCIIIKILLLLSFFLLLGVGFFFFFFGWANATQCAILLEESGSQLSFKCGIYGGLRAQIARPTAVLCCYFAVATCWSRLLGIKGPRNCMNQPGMSLEKHRNEIPIKFGIRVAIHWSVTKKNRENFHREIQQIMMHFVLTSEFNLQY